MSPVRTGTPYLPWHDPREATRLLRYVLLGEAITHTYQSNGVSEHSVSTELTALRDDGSPVWNKKGGASVTHRIDDPVGTARRIARRRQQGPSCSPIDSVCESTV